MKYIKKVIHIFLSFLLILSTVIVHPVEAWATLPNVPGGSTPNVPLPLLSIYETLRDGYNDGATPFDFIKESIKNSGFLSPEIPALSDLSSLDQYITGNAPDLKGDTPEDTAKNVSQFIVNNTTVSDNSVKINSNVKNFNNNLINNYIGNSGYITGYTCNINSNNIYSSYKNAILSFLEQYQNDYYVFIWNSGNYLAIVPKNEFYGVLSGQDSYLYTVDTNVLSDVGYQPQFRFYNGSYIENGTINSFTGIKALVKEKDSGSFDLNYVNIISNGSFPFPIYTNESNASHIRPFYYNNDVWTNYSNSEGDWTFTPTNINTVTYGDTVTYINDYHDTNNNYPDNSTVNTWIENTNEENITNNNNGNGGSGGDDSGGSGSDNDGPTDIFGWLKQLGAVLGSLIKGVGEFLTEIITGLVSAINSLLSGISDLIQNITESLPTVFMDFLGTLFSWLPDEWVALFSACIIFMLLWGIIKTIRGS